MGFSLNGLLDLKRSLTPWLRFQELYKVFKSCKRGMVEVDYTSKTASSVGFARPGTTASS